MSNVKTFEYAREGKKFYVVGSERIEFPEIKRVVFVHREHNILIVWEGNRKTPVTNTRYINQEYFDKTVEDELRYSQSRVDDIINFEKKCAEECADILANSKVGDIFFASWGFEQTNIDYYQVVSIKGKKFGFRQLCIEADYNERQMTGKSLPIPNKFYSDEVIEKAISKSAVFKICDNVKSLKRLEYTLVDGVKVYEPKFYSCYA